jgi:heptaprenyl diphosphate synthase
LTRGFTAGLLSFSGGLCAIAVMILLMAIFKNKPSYYILSVAGGIFHNLGQMAVASLILQTALIVYYLPILIVGGIAAGTITATILKVIMPA